MPATILLVEDEPAIQELIAFNLAQSGHQVLRAASAEAAQTLVKNALPDLVLLDWMLPGQSGIEFARRLRSDERTREVPIIMLTARSEERDELQGFDLGVDEYISKPFSPKILVARVNAILRRTLGSDAGDVMEAGGITIDKAAHIVEIDGKPIELSYKEFELLTYFVENRGIALSREKILNNVWNYDYFGDARTIDTHVKKLRSKLGEKGEYIKTIWGMGYKFEVN